MKTTVQKVGDFHRAFGQPVDRIPTTLRLTMLEAAYMDAVEKQLSALGAALKGFSEECGGSVALLRIQLLTEEVGELAEAFLTEDLEAAGDALTDIQYVLDGTYLAVGLDGVKEEMFDAVHAANMAKLDENGKPIIGPSGRVVKPEGWTPPDLGAVINGPETR